MSNIDEIALNVVKAIAEIDPDKLPGGRTQAVAQAQVMVRDAISGEIEALKAANRDLQDWFDDARATAERAQARVAELEYALSYLREPWDLGQILGAETRRRVEFADAALAGNKTDAWLLRKQAEAVDEAIVYALRAVGNVDPFEVDIHKFAHDYAQRLRPQPPQQGGE